MNFPMYQDGTFSSNFKLGFYEYTSLLTNPSKYSLYVTRHYVSPCNPYSSQSLMRSINMLILCFISSFPSDSDWIFVSYIHPITPEVISSCLLRSRTMFFQQWTGINAILYYAPSIFSSLGLAGNTLDLLATGVVGIAWVFWSFLFVQMLIHWYSTFLSTIPTVIFIDQIGRKPVLISGAFLMGAYVFVSCIPSLVELTLLS